ncbi:MAG: DUF1893 domain-containing protein [Calditrichaeota bacterium]|nr:MAG: DUF1893 domain-containing protein [Calditrichota bacterium]
MTLSEFQKSGKSLSIYSGTEEIFSSDKDALEPLVEFIQSDATYENLVIFDKYIGRAAAMLMTLINPQKVYTPIISQFGREVLQNKSIRYEAEKEVEFLMGVASDSMCRWEKISVGKTAEDLLEMLKKR